MKINNAFELVGKEVVDTNGNTIGIIDKTWNSWNDEYPGYFFGIKPNQNARETYFRGTNKLIPIYSYYIKQLDEQVTLNKTMDQLCRYWNKTVQCGDIAYPADEIVEKPVYDKYHSKVGTFYSWVETDGTYNNYGVWLDPYLCQIWNFPYNKLFPIPTHYFHYIKDTVILDRTLNELKDYWINNYRL
jgi:hypothetical protein